MTSQVFLVRKAASRADRGQPFNGKVTLSFEEPQRMFTVPSEARRRLMLEVMHQPKTINELTHRLQRKRSSITKDIGLLKSWDFLSHIAKPIPAMAFRNLCSRLRQKSRWWRPWANVGISLDASVSGSINESRSSRRPASADWRLCRFRSSA